MENGRTSVLFLGRAKDERCEKAVHFCRLNGSEVTTYLCKRGESLPEDARWWKGDYILAYRSRWVLPDWLLKKARGAAIGFHPASPDYPGIGCSNFAIYEGAQEFGVTCHHLAPAIATGEILAVKRFPVFAADDSASLSQRAGDYELLLFYEIVGLILQGKALPVCCEQWTRAPIMRSQLDELRRLTPDMSREEIARRIRATRSSAWKPLLEMKGFVFGMEPVGERSADGLESRSRPTP
jgi:methionyl-tRNA formyltransferase